MTEPTSSCATGYVCHGGASIPNPTNDLTGDSCPSGYYCSSGTYSPTPCPIGTYSAARGNPSVDSCLSCTPGSYCQTLGATSVSGFCSAGYVCIGGANSSTPSNINYNGGGYICPVGYMCPNASSSEIPCAAGTYNDVLGKSVCAQCPSGYYCTNATVAPTICPSGYYCPVSTQYAHQYSCPAGTYGPQTGLTALSSCSGCLGGHYCATSGLSSPTDICQGGFACVRNSTVAFPTDGITGYRCPTGTFCPPGSSISTQCTAGFYCAGTQNINVTGACQAGFYCVPGTNVSNPSSGICPPGNKLFN